MSMRSNMTQKGYITLFSMLVISAVAVSLVVLTLDGGILRAQDEITRERGTQARNYLDTCIEEALDEIRDVEAYTGSLSLSFSLGGCDATVSNTGGETRLITATGTVSSVMRTGRVEISRINPTILISSWEEVVDF